MNKTKILSEILKDGLKEHVVMRDFTTMKVGGVADYFFEAKTVDELVKAVKASEKAQVPYFILGGGSNIIFSDYGYPGLVIKNKASNIAFMPEKSQVIVDSGTPLAQLILDSTAHDLSGLEFLFGIPGTVGGAVYGNAGAWGQSIGDFVKSVTVLEVKKDEEVKVVQYEADFLEFAYRSTKFKKSQSLIKPVILSVRLQLAQNRQEEIMRRLNTYKEKRHNAQPVGYSAGSIFRNPIPPELKNIPGKGSNSMPELPKERTAGYMLDRAGAKKIKLGDVRVAKEHANFILNTNNAKAQEVRQVIEKMRKLVADKFKINLEEEIEYIGQW